MEIKKAWIEHQRKLKEVACCGVYSPEQARSQTAILFTSFPSALDALEASMQREAEKDAEIERLKSSATPKPSAMLSFDQLDVEQKLRYGFKYRLPVTLDANEVHIAMNAITQIAEKDAAIARLTAERDAAVRDMRIMRTCQNCKHKPVDYSFIHGACKNCDDEDKWQWRGSCAENAPDGAESEGKNE